MNKKIFMVLSAIVLTVSYLQAQETPPQPAGKIKFQGQFIENFDKPTSPFFIQRRDNRTEEEDFRYFPGNSSLSEKGTKVMLYRINPEDPAGAGRGPEIISKDFTHFGTYAARLRIPDVTKVQPDAGAVVGYFTYHRDDIHGLSEIDWEWLIADPEIIYIGTWTGPRGNLQRIGRIINLAKGIIYNTSYRSAAEGNRNQPLTGLQSQPETIQTIENYNAAARFYTYGFDWYPDHLVWWIIHPVTDEKIVLWDYSGATPNFTGIPTNPTLYRFNFWHTNNWPVETRPKSIEKPLYPYEVEIDWMSYKPFKDLNKEYQKRSNN
jgi:hypothetical protein